MKVGFIGGMILLILTLIFSVIAIKNNQIAREVTLRSFGLKEVNTTKKRDFDRDWQEFDKKWEKF